MGLYIMIHNDIYFCHLWVAVWEDEFEEVKDYSFLHLCDAPHLTSAMQLIQDYWNILLGQLLFGWAIVIKQSSSNQELAKLITNNQWPSDQLMALTYYVQLYTLSLIF